MSKKTLLGLVLGGLLVLGCSNSSAPAGGGGGGAPAAVGGAGGGAGLAGCEIEVDYQTAASSVNSPDYLREDSNARESSFFSILNADPETWEPLRALQGIAPSAFSRTIRNEAVLNTCVRTTNLLIRHRKDNADFTEASVRKSYFVYDVDNFNFPKTFQEARNSPANAVVGIPVRAKVSFVILKYTETKKGENLTTFATDDRQSFPANISCTKPFLVRGEKFKTEDVGTIYSPNLCNVIEPGRFECYRYYVDVNGNDCSISTSGIYLDNGEAIPFGFGGKLKQKDEAPTRYRLHIDRVS